MALFNSFTFDNENSLDSGIYITGEAVFNAPERVVEMVNVPGRNGAIAIDEGRFENIAVTYPAGCFADNMTEFAEKVANFRNILASRFTYKRLEDTYYPDEFRMGLYRSGLEVDVVNQARAGKFDIEFDCKPQRFLTSGEEPVDTSELGGEVTTDKIPYLFRRSGGGNIGHDFDAEVDKIIGGSVAWNQLYNGTFSGSGTSSGLTLTKVSDKKAYTVTGTATGDNINVWLWGYYNQSTTILTLLKGHKYFIADCNLYRTNGEPSTTPQIILYLGVSNHTKIISAENDYHYCGVRCPSAVSGQPYNLTIYPKIIDLTATFGTEIADYVYSLEQSTSGSGIAWLKSYGFLTKDYYAYNDGSLVNVKTTAHVMRDEDDAIIGNYPLDSDLELRGIPKLSNGSLYYDGDEYSPSGQVVRRWNTIIYDGTESGWYKHSSGRFYKDYLPSDIAVYGERSKSFGFDYECRETGTSAVYGDIFVFGGSGIYINAISADETVDQFKARLASRPLRVVYPITPTTETADPFASPQIVSPNGTEEYVDTRDVPVPVGHETKYGMSQLVLTNPTEFPSKPLLEVTGVGTFWLGDTLFTITGTAGQTIYIDCETGEAWKNTGGIITPANGLVTLNRLDFPELDPGDTPVMYGTGITKVVVTPRWWRL